MHTMLTYKYSKWMYLLYLLFFPASVLGYVVTLSMLLNMTEEKVLVTVVFLVVWFFVNLYLILMILRSKLIISNDSLIYMSAFHTVEVPFQRVLAYKSYERDRAQIPWSLSLRTLLFPVDRFQKLIEIHYKDFNGRKRTLKQDITSFANSDQLVKNLDNYLK